MLAYLRALFLDEFGDVGQRFEIIRLLEIQVVGENRQHLPATLGDVVRQKLDPVNAHQSEQRIVPSLKLGSCEFAIHRRELA